MGLAPRLVADGDEVTFLILGADPISAPLTRSLEAAGVDVEQGASEHAVALVTAAAPDLVLLVGDAAKAGGAVVLEALASQDSQVTYTSPLEP